MGLFKYMSIEAAEKYFSSSMLKASRPREFNDIFDAYPILPHVSPSEIEEAARIRTNQRKDNNRLLREDLDDPYEYTYRYELWQAKRDAGEERSNFNEIYREELYRIVCFCRSGLHLLMWTHYANNHQGVQLEFDEGHECFNGRLNNVFYAQERPSLSLEDMRGVVSKFRDTNLPVPSFFLTKALEWAYEQEVRLCARRDETTSFGNVNPIWLYKVPFDAIKSITLGARCYDSSLNLQGLVRSVMEREGLQIKSYKIHASNTEYKLERIEVPLYWRPK